MDLGNVSVESVVGEEFEIIAPLRGEEDGLDGVLTAKATVVTSGEGESGGKKSNSERS